MLAFGFRRWRSGSACRRSSAICWPACAIGPFTPGYVADQSLANELAEIGVILLMFGVGLHFSLEGPDVRARHRHSRRCGADRRGDAARHGARLGRSAGRSAGSSCSVWRCRSPRTVVLLRALQERRLVDTERGRIAVGWLIVEDLAMVLTLVLLPPLAAIAEKRAQRRDIWPQSVCRS